MGDVDIEQPKLVALEFVVKDLNTIIALLCDVIGFELVQKGRHSIYDADIAIVSAGELALSLLQPTTTDDGLFFPSPDPRLSQLTFSVPSVSYVDELVERISEAGVPVHENESVVFIDQQMVEEVLGRSPTFVFVKPQTDNDVK